MKHFEISTEIQASPARVWAVMQDVIRWPEWTATVTRIDFKDVGPLRIGSRIVIAQPELQKATWKVTALTPGKGFTWVTGNAILRITATHSVQATASGTRATLTLDFAGWLGGWAARKYHDLNNRYLGIEAAGLKERSESAIPHGA